MGDEEIALLSNMVWSSESQGHVGGIMGAKDW